jgi:hypothetical protein
MVQVVRDPYEASCEEFLVINEDHEIMPVWPWLEWLRRKMEDPKLFVYRHRHTRRFMLCQWLYEPHEAVKPVAQELEGFECEPQGFGWPEDLMHPEVLAARLTPTPDISRVQRERLRSAANLKRSQMEERADIRKEASKRLKSLGLDRESKKMAEGYYPVERPSESTVELTNELMRKA